MELPVLLRTQPITLGQISSKYCGPVGRGVWQGPGDGEKVDKGKKQKRKIIIEDKLEN